MVTSDPGKTLEVLMSVLDVLFALSQDLGFRGFWQFRWTQRSDVAKETVQTASDLHESPESHLYPHDAVSHSRFNNHSASSNLFSSSKGYSRPANLRLFGRVSSLTNLLWKQPLPILLYSTFTNRLS
ncbi:uncharacterized protein YALI1_D02636g [Yarrowia lipolytica]|uniref:Uncharacterized protein n=1 Tax=Yarrowia lipolytica TaxID=4952 RepID=A0A1D8NCV2_YARLL|nr:hypothetical protein YALI1_D02636g [Yarrowia lipolytica]